MLNGSLSACTGKFPPLFDIDVEQTDILNEQFGFILDGP